MPMDGSSIVMILILVILVIFSAYFSATETAFTSLNRVRLRSKAENGNRRAALALRLEEDYDRLLSTLLVGKTSSTSRLPPWAPCCLSS